jgi:4-amino-4-deoxy-L-arabinose transferase-like glycosyltransferase
MRILLPWTNEGTLASGAVRILHGQVFARDFFEVMGPGTFYWLAAFFKAFGTTFLAMRICLFVTSLGTGLLMYFLASRLCSEFRFLPCVLFAGTCYGLQWPGISHHVDSNFFALLSVACMVLWREKRWIGLALAAGTFAGLTTCIHQPKGLFLLIGLACWLLILKKRQESPVPALIALVCAYFSVGILVLSYFWSQGALKSLIYANLEWPSQHYEAVNRVSYALGIFHEYWRQFASAGGNSAGSIAIASILITPFLIIAGLPLLLFIASLRYKWKSAPEPALLFLFCGIAIWLSEFHRRDIYHLVFGSPLLLILLCSVLLESRMKASRIALAVLATTSSCLVVFNLLLVLTAHSVPTRVGTIALYKDNPSLEFLEAHTVPGEEIFAYPYCPIYYFLSATSNPTRYLTLTYNYNTEGEFKDAIRTLEGHRVRFVLWDTNFLAKTAPIVFSEAARRPSYGFLMEDYLSSHYRTVNEANGIRILERKGADSAP